ncbi:MAG: helix-turn-helix transcriptional regulator [Bacillota bacterium]
MYERIRGMREDRDMTQKQMAEYLSIHQTTYSDYELGRLNIPVLVLSKIADLYGTSVDYLIGRTDEKNPYPKSKSKRTT